MILEKWFPTVFYYGFLNNINTEELISFSYNLKNTSKGRITSNVNSWQSEDLDLNLPILKQLLNSATNNFIVLHKELGYKKNLIPIIDNIWININPPGGTNQPHIHFDNILSGVFFLKSNQNSGRLMFPHPAINSSYHFHHKTVEKYNENNSTFCHHIPQEGKMVLFPSYALHYVEPNLSNEDRISIAFNTKLLSLEKTNN
jgi:hypothetical protein